MNDEFYSCNIIVWNGVITQYGNIKHLVAEGDLVRLADENEIKTYNEKRR